MGEGKTTEVQFELTHNQIFYGRVLFEDGRPAVITPPPWEGAKTAIRLDQPLPFGPGSGHAIGDVAEVDAEGCFAVNFLDREMEALRSGTAQLRISLPDKQRDLRQPAGLFPFEKLSEDKAQAGTVTVQRPDFLKAPVAATPAEESAVPAELRSVGSPEEMRQARELLEKTASDPFFLDVRKQLIEYRNASPGVRTLMDRISQVQRGLYFLGQALRSNHPAVIEKKALLATLQKKLEEKPIRLESEFWERVGARHMIFDGTLVSIRAEEKLGAEAATQVLAVVARADDGTAASLSLEELRTSTALQVFQRLATHLPAEPFQALLKLLESKGLVSVIAGPKMCLQEDLPGRIEVSGSMSFTLHTFGQVLASEQAVLLDIQATVKLTEPVPPPAGTTWDQASPPHALRTLSWVGLRTIPNERHAVLPLDAPILGADGLREVYCLLVKPTIVEPEPPAAQPVGSPG